MTNVWFCSDLHVDHKAIAKYRLEVSSEAHNREVIKDSWGRLVTKRDKVFVLGDSAFSEEGIDWIGGLAGEKILIRGNHCDWPIRSYLRVFKEVYGLWKYKNFWLSHAPIHPQELRGKFNLHGHTHYQNIKQEYFNLNGKIVKSNEDDRRYLNCSVENILRMKGEVLINLNEVRSYFK